MVGPGNSLVPRQPPSLVGRDRERAALRDHLTAALAGQGGLVLIGGEAGIGKTALAEEACREAAEQGALVLVGRCYDLSETPPYGPWLAAFARYPAGSDLPPLPEPLAERGRLGAVAGRDALFGQVQDFLAAAAARRPLVVLLDDLHWADAASLDLLRVVARDLAARALLLLAIYRSDELPDRHPLAALLPRLVREARAERLDLAPLDEDAVGALVTARYALAEADLARLVAYLQAHAEGNPFAAGEMLRSLAETRMLRPSAAGWALGDLAAARVPALLRQVIAERVARLADETQRLLALAAVIGQEVPLALWSAVGAVAEEALLDVVERAVEAHLLAATSDGARVRFVHALVRVALYEGVLPPRRRDWHRRIAEALLALPAPDPDAVAYHFQQAGDPRAAEWLVQAGERAQAAYAWLTAAARYEAALPLLEARGTAARERGWLLFRLARMRRFADPRRGLGYLEEALRLATASGDPVLAAHALGMRGVLACLGGELRRGLADLEAGVAAFDALPAPADLQGAPADIGGGMAPTFRGALALQRTRTGRLADATTARAWADLDPAGATLMHEAVATMHAALGRPQEARRAFAQARAGRRAAGHHYQVGLVALHELQAVALPYQADQLAERRALAAEAEAAWNRARTVRPELPPRLIRLPLLLVEGAWAEVPALARPVLEGGRGTYAQQFLVGTLGRLLYARGEGDLVWRLVQKVLPAGPPTAPGDTLFAPALTLQGLAAALALDAGDLPTARAWLEAHGRWLAWSGAVLGQAEGHLGWAAYHRAAGDAKRSYEHAEQALAHASEPRQPLALLAAHRMLGEMDTAAGDHVGTAGHLAEALALADACAAPYERALTLLATAELHTATGARELAAGGLAEARAILTPLEAKPALARADALAARLVAPARPSPATYPAGLTAREVEVLRLVAEGLTDVQVAERLFLSPHTIGAHLRAIYGKLGVTTRSAATRFALEQHLT